MERELQHLWCPGYRLGKSPYGEDKKMNTMLLKMYVKLQDLLSREEGQDLVEYALVVALIAFGAVAGMGALAKGINNEFNSISSMLASAV
jgi:pilus assembly protein Flp/PilA